MYLLKQQYRLELLTLTVRESSSTVILIGLCSWHTSGPLDHLSRINARLLRIDDLCPLMKHLYPKGSGLA